KCGNHEYGWWRAAGESRVSPNIRGGRRGFAKWPRCCRRVAHQRSRSRGNAIQPAEAHHDGKCRSAPIGMVLRAEIFGWWSTGDAVRLERNALRDYQLERRVRG